MAAIRTGVTQAGPDAESKRREIRRYWDAHPISVDSVPHPPGSRESFDAIYEGWERDSAWWKHELLSACTGKRALEIGCGVGKIGRFLAKNGVAYHAVDASRRSLELASAHLSQNGLAAPLVQADAEALPFRDGEFGAVFSLGVLMLAPDVVAALREAVRVAAPGAHVRVMVYNRASYHYVLVDRVVRPLIWLFLKVPLLARGLRFAPQKFRLLYEVCRSSGFDRNRILWASTDTSFPGEGHHHPFTHFLTERELRLACPGLSDLAFERCDLKYFPLPFLRDWVERRWGFFLIMKGTKRAERFA